MTRDELRNVMHDYFNGNLSDDENKRVQSFLEEYDDVAVEYEQMSRLITEAENLKTGIKAPDGILNQISDELLSESWGKFAKEKERHLRNISEEKKTDISFNETEARPKKEGVKTGSPPSKKSVSKGFVLTLLLLVVIAGGYFVYSNFFETNLPWKVIDSRGNYTIDGAAGLKEINSNQVLATGSSASVSITIPEAGRLDLPAESSIKITKGNEGSNRINLLKGSVSFNSIVNEPGVWIYAEPVVVKVSGGDLTLRHLSGGLISVEMLNGASMVFTKLDTLPVVQNYTCRIYKNGKIGIPYNMNTSPELIEEAESFNKNNTDITAVNSIVNLAGENDGITLWYLLKRIKDNRVMTKVYEKLNELYPLPPGVTQNLILSRDKDAMQKWLNEIKWQI